MEERWSVRHYVGFFALVATAYLANARAVIQSFAQLICGPIFGAVLGTGDSASRQQRFPYAIILVACTIVISVATLIVARVSRAGWKMMIKT